MHVWNMPHAAHWQLRKKSPSVHHRRSLSDYIFAIKACIENRKNVKQQYLLNMSSSWSSSRLATTDMGRKLGVVPLWGRGVGTSSNKMWAGPRPTSMPSFILIHPTVWTQCTNVTDRQDRQTGQRSDSIGRTVLRTVAQKMGEPIEIWVWTRLGPRNYILDGGPDLPREEVFLSGIKSGFSRMPLSTVLSGPDVWISPHAVDQRFSWPTG